MGRRVNHPQPNVLATGNEKDQSSIINNNNHGITFEVAMQAFYAAQDEEEQVAMQAFYNAQREEEQAAEHPTQACNGRGQHSGEQQGKAARQHEERAAVTAQAITRGQQARWKLQQPWWKLQQASDVRAMDARAANLMWLARLRRGAGDLEGALMQAAKASDSYDGADLTDLDGAAAARHLEDDILNEITSASPQAHQPIGQLQQTEQSPKPPTLVPPLEPTCHPWSPRTTLGATT